MNMNTNVYEFVPYAGMNYVFLTADVSYCLPHIHKEYEFGIVLDGNMHMNPRTAEEIVRPGEMWLVNPYQYHELASDSIKNHYLILELQVSRAFFHSYFSGIDQLVFDQNRITREQIGDEVYDKIRKLLVSSAYSYLRKDANYELLCAGNINYLFRLLIESLPHHQQDTEGKRLESIHRQRLQRIIEYVDTHYNEKLLLSDLAEQENLSLNYLSHEFKNHLGMSFQTYLQHVRCQKAAILIDETDNTLTEISAICGFSALKYMNQGFSQIYHVTPSEYRLLHRNNAVPAPSLSGIDTLSDKKSTLSSCADDYTRNSHAPFPKPFNTQESIDILKKYCPVT